MKISKFWIATIIFVILVLVPDPLPFVDEFISLFFMIYYAFKEGAR